MEFKEILKQKIDYVEKLLIDYMPKEEGYQETIMKAMNYSLSAGGKRLRPILTLESCKAVGGDIKDAICSFVIGCLVKYIVDYLDHMEVTSFIYNALSPQYRFLKIK